MINRVEELNKLLEKLRGSNSKESDIDLILEYLEKYVSDPKIGGGSKKLLEFQIDNDHQTSARHYRIHWISNAIYQIK